MEHALHKLNESEVTGYFIQNCLRKIVLGAAHAIEKMATTHKVYRVSSPMELWNVWKHLRKWRTYVIRQKNEEAKMNPQKRSSSGRTALRLSNTCKANLMENQNRFNERRWQRIRRRWTTGKCPCKRMANFAIHGSPSSFNFQLMLCVDAFRGEKTEQTKKFREIPQDESFVSMHFFG